MIDGRRTLLDLAAPDAKIGFAISTRLNKQDMLR